MRATYLHPGDDEAIAVRLADSQDMILLECHAAERFLSHITLGRWSEPLGPEAYVRGIVIPREGAQFSLCGPLGVVADDVARLSEDEARTLILDRLW